MRQKILIVEDNPLNLRLFSDLLRANGYDVDGVQDARQAIDHARRMTPDLIVLDIQMPHLTGLELIDRIRADDILDKTPIMAVTAYAARSDEERIKAAGANAYVAKPISLDKFLSEVKALASG